MIWFLEMLPLKCFSLLGCKESGEVWGIWFQDSIRVDHSKNLFIGNFIFFLLLNNNKYSGGSKPPLYVHIIKNNKKITPSCPVLQFRQYI